MWLTASRFIADNEHFCCQRCTTHSALCSNANASTTTTATASIIIIRIDIEISVKLLGVFTLESKSIKSNYFVKQFFCFAGAIHDSSLRRVNGMKLKGFRQSPASLFVSFYSSRPFNDTVPR